MANNPFVKKKTTAKPDSSKAANQPASKSVGKPAGKSASKSTKADEKVVEKKANPFTGSRKDAPLHAAQVNEPKPKAKSFSFYAEDLERLESLRRELSPRSSKRVSDSVVVRVALVYLEEHLKEKDGNASFEKQVRNLLRFQS